MISFELHEAAMRHSVILCPPVTVRLNVLDMQL